MAGTIVSDTLQDGAGNSTATTNAIQGSAKAWVNFNGSTAAIRASYNVSSITKNTTGDYFINFTNALADTNYCLVTSRGQSGSFATGGMNDTTAPTTTAVRVNNRVTLDGTYADQTWFYAAIFR